MDYSIRWYDVKLGPTILVLLLVLQVSSQNVGLYGKQVVSFQCAKSTEPLPSTSISIGEDSLHM